MIIIMSNKSKSNKAKGRNSYDSVSTGTEIEFFNRNITPYPTEAGGPKFELIPIQKQKDIMVNVAILHAEQEYERIMELVKVLQKQASSIKRRLDITNMVHSAKYQFQIAHNVTYWLAHDHRKNEIILCGMGPNGWMSSPPESYEYILAVKWLGDHTWIEVEDDSMN